MHLAPRALVAAAALASFALAGAPAEADHSSYEPGAGLVNWYQEHGFPGRDESGSRYRAPEDRCSPRCDERYCDPCDRRCDDCAPRTPWSVLRRHLQRRGPGGPAWHRHAECWFLRRWPVPTDPAPALAGAACEQRESAVSECPLTQAALAEDRPVVTVEERLLRGLERFRRGRTEEAAADFRAAAESDPKEPRAVYGTLMCAFLSHRWAEAAGALRSLEALGALDGGDRLDTADAFEDPARPASILAGLRSYAQWSFHESDVQLVLGWGLAATGKPGLARPHLKAALRFSPDDPAAKRLLADLEKAPAAPAPAGK